MTAPPVHLSRETTIRIDREGVFWHEDQRFTNTRLAHAFASWVDIDPESGRYIIKNAINWCFITVEDAPLVVHAVDDAQNLLLSDGTLEPLDRASLRIDEDDVPYCDVRGGRLPARFLPGAAFSLIDHLVATGELERVRRVPRGKGAR